MRGVAVAGSTVGVGTSVVALLQAASVSPTITIKMGNKVRFITLFLSLSSCARSLTVLLSSLTQNRLLYTATSNEAHAFAACASFEIRS